MGLQKHTKVHPDGTVEIQHFDSGGTVINGNSPTFSTNSGANVQGSFASQPSWIASSFSNPIGSAADTTKNIATDFTTQNGYQAQQANIANTDYGDVIGAAGSNALAGYGNFQNLSAQQQQLAKALMAQSNGQGPNPAQAALAQNTGQNISAQAALMAGQRGTGANAGLAARQIGQQGAATQQQAVGQEATLQANQQIAAEQALAQQQQNMLAANTAEQNANTSLFGSGAGAQNAQNSNIITNLNNAQTINSGTAQKNADAVNKTEGGLLNGAGSLLSFLNKGGVVKPKKYDDGGAVSDGGDSGGGMSNPLSALGGGKDKGPDSVSASDLKSLQQKEAHGGKIAPNPKIAAVLAKDRFSGALEPHIEHIAKIYHPDKFNEKFANGGMQNKKVPALVSPGEAYLTPQKAKEVVQKRKNPLAIAEKIPGKPKVKGDSEKNDVVPKKLDVGGVVIPNSVMQSDDPSGNAAKFVAKLMEKQTMGGGDHVEFKSALKKAIASRKAN